MNYFKCFSWKELVSLLIALLPCVYFFYNADCSEKNALALFALILFLWLLIPLVKKNRELESEITSLNEKSSQKQR